MDAPLSSFREKDLTSEESTASVRNRGAIAVIAIVAAILLIMLVATPGIRMIAQESRRKQCEVNLNRLGLAFHEYHNAHGHFPAPAVTRGDGTPLLSWRVALLPQLGYQQLYDRFHLDEPWDSPHNRPLLALMPAELACPDAAVARDGKTGYMVVVGPKIGPQSASTPFDASRRRGDRRDHRRHIEHDSCRRDRRPRPLDQAR